LPFKNNDAKNLEQLLESLIKMVGKANQKVDSLQKRVSQLEMQLEMLAKQQHENRESAPIRIFS